MKTRADELRDEFEAFLVEHPEVWRLFLHFTFQAINAGHKHMGVAAVWERIRWETTVGAQYTDESWKLNNNFRAPAARRFAELYPRHATFFRTRRQRSAEQDAVELPPLGPAYFEDRAA